MQRGSHGLLDETPIVTNAQAWAVRHRKATIGATKKSRSSASGKGEAGVERRRTAAHAAGLSRPQTLPASRVVSTLAHRCWCLEPNSPSVVFAIPRLRPGASSRDVCNSQHSFLRDGVGRAGHAQCRSACLFVRLFGPTGGSRRTSGHHHFDRMQYTPNVGSLRTLMTRLSGAVVRSEDRARTKARQPDALRRPWQGARGQ
jgi:hypothetical protein